MSIFTVSPNNIDLPVADDEDPNDFVLFAIKSATASFMLADLYRNEVCLASPTEIRITLDLDNSDRGLETVVRFDLKEVVDAALQLALYIQSPPAKNALRSIREVSSGLKAVALHIDEALSEFE